MKVRFWQTDGMSGSHDLTEIPGFSMFAEHTLPAT